MKCIFSIQFHFTFLHSVFFSGIRIMVDQLPEQSFPFSSHVLLLPFHYAYVLEEVTSSVSLRKSYQPANPSFSSSLSPFHEGFPIVRRMIVFSQISQLDRIPFSD